MSRPIQKGFSSLAIIFVILVVAVLGFIGWRVYETNKLNPTQQTQNDPNVGYLVIREWGVRIKPVEGLVGFKALPRTSGLANTEEMMLITSDMEKLNAGCSGEVEGSRPLGALVRTNIKLENPGNKMLLANIGNYYFYYYDPSSSCSPDAANEATQAVNLVKVKDSLASLEAIK